jgi:hypothetical protein
MVRVIMIVEMAGRPAVHLTESLEKHVGVLRDVEDVEIHEIKVSEPRIIVQEEGKEVAEGEALNGHDSGESDMFTAFAECDIEVPSFARMSETMFDFMPSSVEVIEPNSVNLGMTEATDLLNNISGRLHRYDEIAKILGERHKQMEAQLVLAKKILDAKDKEIAELKKGAVRKSVPSKKKVVKKKAVKKKPVARKSVPSKKGTKVPASSGKKTKKKVKK